MSRAIFLDRDGVINKEINYAHKREHLRLINNSSKAIRLLNQKGFKVIIITNQAGIAKGYYDEKDVELFHEELLKRLKKNHAVIDAIFYCPHHPQGKIQSLSFDCSCRKPKTGLIEKAVKKFSINVSQSFLIGDKLSDIEAGKNAGCQTIMVKTGHGKEQSQKIDPSYCIITRDLYNAVNQHIL